MTKRLSFALVLTALVLFVMPTLAMANFAIHGNYVADTDACAGCHRAHTSVSSLTWTDGNDQEQSALLVSSATSMKEFCYACHDATSQGADTNVQWGIFEGEIWDNNETSSTVGGTLNGGGFESVGGEPILGVNTVTSMHDSDGGTWGAYGGGDFSGATDLDADGEHSDTNALGVGDGIVMDCATCHDPHGTSNYRLLKAEVYGTTVGGYEADGETPDPFVQSTEDGWPAGGFRKHQAYPDYRPSYTAALYAKGYDGASEDTVRGMTGWCSGCHTVYNDETSIYNAGDAQGLVTRHRHPVNSEMAAFAGVESLVVTDNPLPLAHSLDESSTGPVNEMADWVECLTCHRAHGTAAKMEGYAGNEVVDADLGDELPSWVSPGINGEHPSALLRSDNRGVCEACHNK